MSFIHLSVFSGYSLMNSTITIKKLVEKASKKQFSALALTDHHVLYGAIEFYKECKKHDIKPLLGMSIDVEIDGEVERCQLLAKNNTGYEQLMKISTYIHLENRDYVEFEQLEQYGDHLVCILQVTDGNVGSLLQNSTHEQVMSYLKRWQHVFSKEDLYLAISDHGTSRERNFHELLKVFSESYNVPVVATNDVHYLDEQDYVAYECLLAIKSGDIWKKENNLQGTKQRHLRSEAEMKRLFAENFPEALANTRRVSEQCTVTFDFDKQIIPTYPVPENGRAHEYLEKICLRSIKEKYDTVSEEISQRLAYELNVIRSMGFSNYFLIVWDFVKFAKQEKIIVGPGRGSAAGSLVSYVLGITDVDPIKYDLLFERFLNPERISMPDIDIDFSDHRRDEVINYVREKYGVDRVAQIITFGTFGVRSLLRELIKVLAIHEDDARFVLQEASQQDSNSIVQFVRQSTEITKYLEHAPYLKNLFKIAVKLEGLPRHVSTHAAGVIISDEPLSEYIPITTGSSDSIVTQYAMDDLESIGLLKMDFLGVRNLTLIERILQSIHYQTNHRLVLNELPSDDQKTFELLQKGNTNGVFQLESQGMKSVLRDLLPNTFEDIVAVNALFRPGPMEYIGTYIKRKHKKETVTYLHEALKPILSSTYGVPIYQEQIMKIAKEFAGFSLGEADIFRRTLSNEDKATIEKSQVYFIESCLKNGYDNNIATGVFKLIKQFTKYGFNRSHAVAYSKVSYQLAYLKANYPAHFFVELLSSITNQQEKISNYLTEAKRIGLAVYPPSINKSIGKYRVESNGIRMGLLSIKGIGFQVVKEVLRAKDGKPFKDLFDFCLRVSSRIINKNHLELLIKSGAFDETYSNRASLLASLDQAIDQGVLFKEFTDEANLLQNQINLLANYTEIADFSDMKKLADEKELLGLYISPHPLLKYRNELTRRKFVKISQAEKLIGNRQVKIVAIVQSIRVIRTKKGESMAFVTLSDEEGELDGVVFPTAFRKARLLLEEEAIIDVVGKIDERNNQIQYILNEISSFDLNAYQTSKQRLFLKVTKDTQAKSLDKIKEIATKHPGSTPVIVYNEEQKKTYQLTNDYYLEPTSGCLQDLRAYFGEKNIVLED